MCVCIFALVTRHGKHMLSIIFSPVAHLAVSYFSILPNKLHYFRKKIIKHKMCSDFLHVPSPPKNCLILRILQRDITIAAHRFSCKVPLLLPHFNQTLTFSTDFQKSSNIRLDEKPSSGNRVLFHVGRRTDRRTDRQTDRQTRRS